MKLVLYTENHILEVLENIRSPVVDGNSLSWESGSVHDAGLFILLDDGVDMSNGITDEIILLDKKLEFVKPLEVDETAELKARVESTEEAIIALMNFM